VHPRVRPTVLVTGATDGLGRGLAHALAARGANVLVHGRDAERGAAAIREIREATGSDRLQLHLADFSSLEEVRRLAGELQREHDRLDVLVNNAGVYLRRRQTSADGIELTFAVNYLAPFLLTHLLLGALRASAPARIVNVASAGQAPIDFADPMLERGYDGFRAYAQSKLAQIAFTFELAERLEPGIAVNALHPATLMPTKMVREGFGRTHDSLEQGVAATLRLALDERLDGVSGRYFDGERESRAHRQAYDRAARRELWRLSERLCGL
jgi:NAD(P)-dependent dehydrogenase (short-subunit alcohol dehydrogenase family)